MACICEHAATDHADGSCVNRKTRFDATAGEVVTARCRCTQYAEAGTEPVAEEPAPEPEPSVVEAETEVEAAEA